jgi:hypothetical protein
MRGRRLWVPQPPTPLGFARTAPANAASGRITDDLTLHDAEMMALLVLPIRKSGVFNVQAWATYTSSTATAMRLGALTGAFTINSAPKSAGFFVMPNVGGGNAVTLGFTTSSTASPNTYAITDLATPVGTGLVGFYLVFSVAGESATIEVDGAVNPAASLLAIELP